MVLRVDEGFAHLPQEKQAPPGFSRALVALRWQVYTLPREDTDDHCVQMWRGKHTYIHADSVWLVIKPMRKQIWPSLDNEVKCEYM